MIQLVKDTIDNKDVDQLIEWLKTYPRLTKGPLTLELEKKFAEWIGTKYSVFVNSGSSANLLMLYVLELLYSYDNIIKVVVPSLSWSTDLAPVMQLGMKPILCDCNLDNLSVDLNHLEQIFLEQEPHALLLVSVLGLVPEIDKIIELCNAYGVLLLEDNCESQGSEFKKKKLGNFGLMSSFSTYFGHTMSTIEGGFVCTNDENVYNLLLQLRSHGWDRDLKPEFQQKLREQWNVDNFNSLYTFYTPGFNLRNTEIGAFLGLKQLEKVDKLIEKRNDNFKFFKKLLEGKTWFPKETSLSYTASFCIPIIFKSKKNKENSIKEFKENQIEIRPLIAGSMGSQPIWVERHGKLILPNCNIVDECGIYVPNHPLLEEKDIEKICEIIIKNDRD